MVNYRKDDMLIPERSPVWSGAASTALIGGAGYGLYRARAGIKAALGAGSRDIAHESVSQLRTLGRFNVAPMNTRNAVADVSENILSRLADSSSERLVRSDMASAAYESILAGGRVPHTDAFRAYQEILTQTSVRNSYNKSKELIQQLQGDVGVLIGRVNELGEGGFYTLSRKDELSKAVLSKGFANISRDQARIASEIEAKAMGIKSRLNQAASAAGGQIRWGEIQTIDDVLNSQNVTTHMLTGKIGGEKINIPISETGLTYSGENLTTRFVTRKSFGDKGELKTYTEEYIRRLEESMSVQKTKTGLKNAVIQANQNIVETMRNRDSAARSMAIWRMPEAMLPAGGRVKARINAMQAVYSGGKMTEDIRKSIISESLKGGRQLYPIGSPDVVAKGTFITRNITEDLFGPMGRLMSIEQQPLQFIREQWGVTEASKMAAPAFKGTFGGAFNRLERKIQGSKYREILYGGAPVTSAEAYNAPQLITFYAKKDKFETGQLAGIMGREEAVISKRAAPFMEYERTVQKKISLNEGFRVNKELAEGLRGKPAGELVKFKPFGTGGFLGIERATGKELWLGAEKGVSPSIIGAQMTGSDEATVFLKERHKLSDDKWWKLFSEDAKFMGKASGQRRMKEVLEAVGATTNIAGQEIEAVVSGKLVERNKMALMDQQIEAMSMIVGKKIDKNQLSIRRKLAAQEFLSDPSQSLRINKLLGDNLAQAELDIQKNMVAMTKKFGFTDMEMQLTFGLMDEEAASRLGILSQVQKSEGVIGLSKMMLGDIATENLGGRATFEQTGFRLLAMKGEEGKRFAAELATRIKGKGELLATNRMEASILNQADFMDRIKRTAAGITTEERLLGQLRPEELIGEQGRYVKFGRAIEEFGGAKGIYIPGTAEAESIMRPIITGKGQRIESPIVRNINELRGLLAKGADKAEIEEAAKAMRANIVQISESQATARGKIIGSRSLTGFAQRKGEGRAFKISKRTASHMFDDLLERAKTSEQQTFLKQQKRKLIDEGQELIGGMWRHPTTGPESFQFVRYKVDKGIADDMISAPYQMGQLSIGKGPARTVDISEMVGFKGDFDKDMFALSAISDRDTYKRLGKKMQGEIESGYTNYLFNHYAMKDLIDTTQAKNKISELTKLTHAEALEAGARNLTAAKIATPQVNVALQQLKIGMQHTAPEKYRPMAELFWHLEEAAIGGKHGAQQSRLYQDIAHSVRQKDVSTMESVIKRIMGEKDLEVSGTITGPTGEKINRTLKYNPKQWAQEAINAASLVSEEASLAQRAAQTAKGNVPEDLDTIIKMYAKRRTGSIDVAQSLMHSQAYGMPGFTERTNRVMRRAQTKIGAFSKALKMAKGPAVIGGAVAAGLMMAAPSVSGALTAPTEGVAGGKNIFSSDMGPPTGLTMNPPAPRIMESPKAYDMSGIEMSSRAKIKLSMPDADSSSKDFMRHASNLAIGGKVRIRTTDNREALSSHRLANRIHERL